jgi:hypothetical protein
MNAFLIPAVPPVAARLAGGGGLEIAIAGKSCSYIELRPARLNTRQRFAGDRT